MRRALLALLLPALVAGAGPAVAEEVRDRQATLTVTTDRTGYAYDAVATVTATLDSGSANRLVAVWATSSGGVKELVALKPADPLGRVIVQVPVTRRTTFTASNEGDHEFAAATGSRTVTVAARVASTMADYTSRSGGYYLYRVADGATMDTEVSPDHAGDCLYVVAQYHQDGAWHPLTSSDCFALDDSSAVRVLLRAGSSLVGVPVRMRAEWRGDVENSSSTGAWQYVKYVR